MGILIGQDERSRGVTYRKIGPKCEKNGLVLGGLRGCWTVGEELRTGCGTCVWIGRGRLNKVEGGIMYEQRCGPGEGGAMSMERGTQEMELRKGLWTLDKVHRWI